MYREKRDERERSKRKGKKLTRIPLTKSKFHISERAVEQALGLKKKKKTKKSRCGALLGQNPPLACIAAEETKKINRLDYVQKSTERERGVVVRRRDEK